MKNNKGFTLIELLATAMILAVIASLTIVSIVGFLDNAKEKSYKNTISNIEKTASVFLKENTTEISFVGTGEEQYQCIKVKHLIDSGYFDNDILKSPISKNKNVEPDMYVYVSRNNDTKVVKTAKLIYDVVNPLNDHCKDISGDLGKNITFSYEGGWTKSKNVTIEYKLTNITNQNPLDKYSYSYSIDGTEKINKIFSKTKATEEVTLKKNATIEAKIFWPDEENPGKNKSYTKSIYISTIDNDAPKIGILSGDSKYEQTKNITVTISEIIPGSGFDPQDKSLNVKYGWSTSNTKEPTTYQEAVLNYPECPDNTECQKIELHVTGEDLTGEYYLWIKPTLQDIVGNVVDSTVSTGTYKFDNEQPVVNISRKDYNTIDSSKSTDNIGGLSYYYSKENIKPEQDSVWTESSTYDITSDGTYYVWAKDSVGNISEEKSITAYKVLRNEELGTTLETRYEKSTGEEFKNTTYALQGTPIYITGTLKEGYNNLTLKFNKETITNGTLKVVNEETTITSFAGDSTAPTITYIAFDDENNPYKSGEWTAKKVYTKISATDTDSGVDEIQYILKEDYESGKTWKVFNFDVSELKQEGNTWTGTESWSMPTTERNQSYYFRACDKGGNCTPKEKYIDWNIKYDLKAPSIPVYIATHQSDGTEYISGNWTNRVVNTKISSSDTASGVAEIQYILKEDYETGKTWKTFNFNISKLKQEENNTWTGIESWSLMTLRDQSYYFRACDKVGNCSKISEIYNIKYDTIAPMPAITVDSCNKFSYSAIDSTNAKVIGYYVSTNNVKPSINSSGWTTNVSNEITVGTAQNTYYVWSKDEAGNISAVSSKGLVKITRIQGANSTLTTRYNSTSLTTGTEFNNSIYVLPGDKCTVWSGATTDTGFILSLTINGTKQSNSSSALTTIKEATTIESLGVGKPYTINYYVGNGTSTVGNKHLGSTTCTYKGECTLTKWSSLDTQFPNSTKNGWKFHGWTTTQTSTTKKYSDNETFTYDNTNNLNLYAVGKRTFNFYSGKAPTTVLATDTQYWNPYKLEQVTTINVPSSIPINDTWKFIGYRATNDASSKVIITTIGDYKPRANDLTAFQFRSIYERQLIIEYDGNGHTAGSTPNSTTMQYYNSGYAKSGENTGANITTWSFNLPTNNFTKSGYQFKNWQDGDKNYAENDTYTWTPSVTSTTVNKSIKAIWTANTATITITKDGNAYSNLKVALYQGTNQKYTNPTEESGKYTFTGVVNGEYDIYINDKNTKKTVNINTTGNANLKYFTLTVKSGTNIKSTTGTGIYLESSSVDITATPNDNYNFDSWSYTGNVPTNTALAETTISINKTTTLTATAKDTTKPNKPTITISDCDTFTYSATDGVGVTGYYISTSNSKPSLGTISSKFALDTWTTEKTTSDITLPNTNTTYYIWARDAAGNISEVQSKSLVKITRIQGTNTTLTTRYNSTTAATGTKFTETIYVLPSTKCKVWANATASTGYNVTLTNNESSMNNPGTISISNATKIESTANNVDKPTKPVIEVSDCDTFSYSSTDSNGITGYYISTNSTKPTSNDAAWTTKTTSDITLPTSKTTYYIWAKDDAGNISDNAGIISLVKITRSEGTNTTLTTRYNSTTASAGTKFTGTLYVLPSSKCQVYIKATNATGYNGTRIKVNDNDYTTSYTSITEDTTIASTNAIINTATIKINKDNAKYEGLNVDLYKDGTNKYSNPQYDSGSYKFQKVVNGTYDIYIGGSDTGIDVIVENTGTKTINYYTLTLKKGTGISSVTGSGVYLSGTTVKLKATPLNCYTFNKWGRDSGSNLLSDGTSIKITSKTSLTAKATANTSTLTLDPTNGIVSNPTKTITYNQQYDELPNPTRTNYTFNGWYTAKTGGTKVLATTNVTSCSNHTLYAQWTENVISDLKVTISGNPIIDNTLTAKPSTSISGTEYTYQWYRNSTESVSGATKITGATSSTYKLNNSDLAKYIFVKVTANADNYSPKTVNSNILGPVRKTYTYTATFYPNGATITHQDIQLTTDSQTGAELMLISCSVTTTDTNGKCHIKTPTISKTAEYTNLGWGISQDDTVGSEPVDGGGEIELSSNKTYYAIRSISDKTPPVITLNESCIKYGESIDLTTLVTATDSSGIKSLIASPATSKDLKVGKQTIKYTAIDNSPAENKTEFEATITVFTQIKDSVKVLEGISATNTTTGLYRDGNRYIYRGSKPKNYIKFAGAMWRIISIESDGTFKIIYDRKDSTGKYYYKNGNETVELIGPYSNTESIPSYEETAANTALNKFYNSLDKTAKSQIQKHKFSYGQVSFRSSNSDKTISNTYTAEKNSNISINIGLPNITDYLMASNACAKSTNWSAINNAPYQCKEKNWMYNSGSSYWFLNLYSNTRARFQNNTTDNQGAVSFNVPTDQRAYRPVVYLKYTTTFTGTGTDSDPYKINSCSGKSSITCTLSAKETYDNPQVLTISVPEGSTVKYSFNGSDFSSTTKTKNVTKAGTYTAYIKDSVGLINKCSITLKAQTQWRTSKCNSEVSYSSWSSKTNYSSSCSVYSRQSAVNDGKLWAREKGSKYQAKAWCSTGGMGTQTAIASSKSECDAACTIFDSSMGATCSGTYKGSIMCTCNQACITYERSCECPNEDWSKWGEWSTKEVSETCSRKVEERTAFGT